LAESIHSPADWGAVRTKQPELFAKAMSEGGVDNSEHLLRAMDRHGVTHAIVQTAPGKGITNRMVLDAAEKSGRRFFPIYRPEAVSSAAAKGDLGTGSREDNARVVSQVADELRSPAMRAMLGVGEITPISTEVHPALITRDMAPIMEVLKGRGGLPIMFPTGFGLERPALLHLPARVGGRVGRDLSRGADRPNENGTIHPRVLRCSFKRLAKKLPRCVVRQTTVFWPRDVLMSTLTRFTRPCFSIFSILHSEKAVEIVIHSNTLCGILYYFPPSSHNRLSVEIPSFRDI
jgi:hypothetical protein